ncbi:hypothetical protein Tco_0616924, partial [Tanacetum coccineum]
NWIFGRVAPSKCRAFPIARLVDPSSVLGGPANHLGSCCGKDPQSPQLPPDLRLLQLPHHHPRHPPPPQL